MSCYEWLATTELWIGVGVGVTAIVAAIIVTVVIIKMRNRTSEDRNDVPVETNEMGEYATATVPQPYNYTQLSFEKRQSTESGDITEYDIVGPMKQEVNEYETIHEDSTQP